jgi:hypothetical protein
MRSSVARFALFVVMAGRLAAPTTVAAQAQEYL